MDGARQHAILPAVIQVGWGERMLERIESIQGVGLLHDANGKLYTCQKATLVYADNGRGKSTLRCVETRQERQSRSFNLRSQPMTTQVLPRWISTRSASRPTFNIIAC
jgi:hypothetical protein